METSKIAIVQIDGRIPRRGGFGLLKFKFIILVPQII